MVMFSSSFGAMGWHFFFFFFAGNIHLARCMYCNTTLVAHKSGLEKHQKCLLIQKRFWFKSQQGLNYLLCAKQYIFTALLFITFK